MTIASIASSPLGVEVLRSLRAKGIELWSEGGHLHYRAAKGVLGRNEIDQLRLCREEIIALLQRPAPALSEAPLAFSQLSRWYLLEQSEVPSLRQVTYAATLRGCLNVEVLRAAIDVLIERHDALKTRFVIREGVPIQVVDREGRYAWRADDLSLLAPEARQAELERRVDQFALERVDLAVDPLFGVQLIKSNESEHLLVLAMHHMISDGASLSLAARDLFTAYVRAIAERKSGWPPVSIQFPEYAVRQQEKHGARLQERGAYWTERLLTAPRLRFPADSNPRSIEGKGWGVVPVRINTALKTELNTWSQSRHTTVVMSVFTAYVALVLRWCRVSEGLVQYQNDGRAGPELENTIGFFASSIYLRIRVSKEDTFLDLMNFVTQEYCRAYENADSSYLSSQVPRPEFTRNPLFNWVPQGAKIDMSALDGSPHALTLTSVLLPPTMLEKLELDYEPVVLFYETDAEAIGEVLYARARHSRVSIGRFARNLLMFIETLLRRPEKRILEMPLL